MAVETKLLFGPRGETLRWHEPPGRSSGYIPHSHELWLFMYQNRPLDKGGTGLFAGFAHTHPWDGPASPSYEDVTTFRTLETGLGGLFWWPVVTFTNISWLRWGGSAYVPRDPPFILQDLQELRDRSR
jgi:hypothetical protein